MPALRAVFTDTLLLRYVDRWVTLGTWTRPDPCAPHDGIWANYGKTYGPDGKGGCIKGAGRFPDKHGASKDEGFYGSPFVNEMWTKYRKIMH